MNKLTENYELRIRLLREALQRIVADERGIKIAIAESALDTDEATALLVKEV